MSVDIPFASRTQLLRSFSSGTNRSKGTIVIAIIWEGKPDIRVTTWWKEQPDARRMLLLCTLFFLPAFATAETTQPTVMQDTMEMQLGRLKSDLDQVNQGISSFFDAMTSISRSHLEARKKKYKLNKYLLPLMVGFIMIKSILLPIALKALAVLSGKAVVLSLMSLILAAIVGLKKVAQGSPGSNYEVVAPSKYRRQDLYEFPDDALQNEPYKYYKEQRRKK